VLAGAAGGESHRRWARRRRSTSTTRTSGTRPRVRSDLQLIVVLRDPVERAYSHYQMQVRRRGEQRTFEERPRRRKRRCQEGAS
jgi:hypothetical protein